MREHLLGYLLGALEPSEQEQVERRLETDPELRRLLDLLRKRLDALECLGGCNEPPAGLAERTCNLIGERHPDHPTPRGGSSPEVFTGLGGSHRADAPHRVSANRVSANRATDSPATGGSGANRWSLADLLVAATVLAAAAVLFLPALASTRQNSRLAQCQNNLRTLGIALASYSDASGGYFPYIPPRGKLSAAGLYAPMLVDGGYASEQGLFVCPGSDLARRREGWRLRTLREIENTSDEALARVLRDVGGAYGYSLGFVEKDCYQAPRNQGRHNYALLADAPRASAKARQSTNHGGCGQNVLFEDLSVRYIVGCTLAQLGDDIFENDAGLVSAGLTSNDTVLGPSDASPFAEDELK